MTILSDKLYKKEVDNGDQELSKFYFMNFSYLGQKISKFEFWNNIFRNKFFQ